MKLLSVFWNLSLLNFRRVFVLEKVWCFPFNRGEKKVLKVSLLLSKLKFSGHNEKLGQSQEKHTKMPQTFGFIFHPQTLPETVSKARFLGSFVICHCSCLKCVKLKSKSWLLFHEIQSCSKMLRRCFLVCWNWWKRKQRKPTTTTLLTFKQ